MKELLITMRQVYSMAREVLVGVLGGWDGLLYALVIFMIVDYLMGILVVISNRKLSDKIGFSEIAKKLSIILLVIVAHVIDAQILQNGDMVRVVVILFYLSTEGTSILANVALLHLPVPQKLNDILEQLKDKKSK